MTTSAKAMHSPSNPESITSTAVRALATGNGSKALESVNAAREPQTGVVVPTTSGKSLTVVPSANGGHFDSTSRFGSPWVLADRVSDAKLFNQSSGVLHSHYCSHCNHTFTCRSNPCLIPGKPLKIGDSKPMYPNYDISKLHKCNEATKYRKMIAAMLGDKSKCNYGCTKDCSHPKLVSDNNGESTKVSSYSIDGITSAKEVINAHNAWNKAKLNRVVDSFNDAPWLASIAKEFRQR